MNKRRSNPSTSLTRTLLHVR